MRQGLRLIQTNFRSRFGEIDLVMEEQESIVFIEVRYRNQNSFGGALESIDYRKQEKLRASAAHFMQTHAEQRPCRFDVIAVTGAVVQENIEWIRNAF